MPKMSTWTKKKKKLTKLTLLCMNYSELWWTHKSPTWWHSCTITRWAGKQTPVSSLRPTWQRLELCWHLRSLSGLILQLCSHGVRGKAEVAMTTPVDGAIELRERRAQGGAAAAHQHRNLCLPIILARRLLPPSSRSVNLSLSLSLLPLRSLLTGLYFSLGS